MIQRKPEWLRISRKSTGEYAHLSGLARCHGLHTICESGKCPNHAECWSRGTATFMLLGDICTRGCRFCATQTGIPLPPDPHEPEKLADTIKSLKLKHIVLTSVTRDDLPDEGAAHWKTVILAIRERCPNTTIEVLVPDFHAREDLIEIVASAQPDIMAHNIETVRRLTPQVRAKATYEQSLKTLEIMSKIACQLSTDNYQLKIKSSLMLGLGETDEEILQTMDDLLNVGVSIFTMGQYLQPSKKHYPVADYITPEHFTSLGNIALSKGFRHVVSAPLVRSSYHAEEALKWFWHGNCKTIK